MINPKGSNTKKAREDLEQIAREYYHLPLLQQRILAAVKLLHRAKSVRKSQVKHRGWSDPLLKSDILTTAAMNPDWSIQQISIFCGCNTARVSEAIAGLV